MDSQKRATLFKRLLFGGITIGSIVGTAYLDAYVWPSKVSRIVLLLLGMLAQWELFVLVSKLDLELKNPFHWGLLQKIYRRAVLANYLVPLLFFPAAFFLNEKGFEKVFLTMPGYLFLRSLFPIFRSTPNASFFKNPFTGLFLIPIPIACLWFVRQNEAMGALQGLLFLIAVAKIGDIAAYFTGSFLGKHKFAPNISPNKTWEGAIASVITAIGLAAFLQLNGWAGGFQIHQAMLTGLVLNVTAQVGDLSKSILKRAAGVKDSATYFSVMGGALDMIDSLIFAAPAYVALRMFWS